MNYPIWDVPLIGSGWVIGIIAIFHMMISHFAVGAGLYLPLARRGHVRRLPYADYFLYFSRLGSRIFWGTVYDKLVPPIAYYLSQDTVRRWLANADLVEIALRHRNANSWTCLARRSAAA